MSTLDTETLSLEALEPETLEMTDQNWEIAYAIAQSLVEKKTDVNELKKAISYLRNSILQNQLDIGPRFFTYLKTLTKNAQSVSHSKSTIDYYKAIADACKPLEKLQQQPKAILLILGWVARLMKYYKEGGSIEISASDPAPPIVSERQLEITKITQSQTFQLDQILDATVVKVSDSKVTYELFGIIRLTEKKPKKASGFQEGQAVKVKVEGLKEDGSIRKIKWAGEKKV